MAHPNHSRVLEYYYCPAYVFKHTCNDSRFGNNNTWPDLNNTSCLNSEWHAVCGTHHLLVLLLLKETDFSSLFPCWATSLKTLEFFYLGIKVQQTFQSWISSLMCTKLNRKWNSFILSFKLKGCRKFQVAMVLIVRIGMCSWAVIHSWYNNKGGTFFYHFSMQTCSEIFRVAC